MKKTVFALVILGALGGGGFAYYKYRKTPVEPTITTAAVTRGDIADTVGATGTLQAVTTVQVGTQVSGIVQDLYADFNTLVKKGQVIARLDPSTIQTQIEQARANLARAQADLERLKVASDDANNKLRRARELSARQLIPASDLETAEVTARAADAQIRSAEASIAQSQASLRQNEVNLEHTVITAPIDGLVISRNVDRGQTVAASMQAPTLFVLAADLTKMQVVANLDESDVGRIRPGQAVRFHVDAYPTEEFTGKVTQVRLQPIIQQNVVTYATVIDVPNPELKLKPGMTANVNVEIARRTNVIRVPNAALRFRPTNETFAALGQAPPENLQRGDSGGRGRGRGNGGGPAPSGNPSTANRPPAPVDGAQRGRRSGVAENQQPANSNQRPKAEVPELSQPQAVSSSEGSAPPAPEGRPAGGRGAAGGGDRSGSGRGFAERMQNASPEEREQMLQRMRARGIDPSAQPGRSRPANDAAKPKSDSPVTEPKPGATTIDALFGPLPVTETRGPVWVAVDKKLKALPLRLGITDGQVTELIEGELEPGTEVVTNVTLGSEARPAPQGGFPPFIGQPGRGGFGQGGFGGNRGGGGGGGPRGGGR
jgi:HlyD family secretion protein